MKDYKNHLAICENCEEEVTYETKKVTKQYTIKGIAFEVEIFEAFCSRCHEQVFPYELSKKNDILIYDEYKKRVGLLTSQEIIDIRKKRGMSQHDLAKFIHCGEKNIARYENGAIQDEVFDNLIRMVGDDRVYGALCYFYGYTKPFSINFFVDGNFLSEEGTTFWQNDCLDLSSVIHNKSIKIKVQDLLFGKVKENEVRGNIEHYGNQNSCEKVGVC